MRTFFHARTHFRTHARTHRTALLEDEKSELECVLSFTHARTHTHTHTHTVPRYWRMRSLSSGACPLSRRTSSMLESGTIQMDGGTEGSIDASCPYFFLRTMYASVLPACLAFCCMYVGLLSCMWVCSLPSGVAPNSNFEFSTQVCGKLSASVAYG